MDEKCYVKTPVYQKVLMSHVLFLRALQTFALGYFERTIGIPTFDSIRENRIFVCVDFLVLYEISESHAFSSDQGLSRS